jgi:hypothetical protein
MTDQASAAAVGAAALKTLLRALRDRLLKGRRDPGKVQEEYDQGYWKDFYDARDWESQPLRDLLIPPSSAPMLALVDGGVVSIPVDDYYQVRLDRLAAVIRAHALPDTRLIEVGCGWGMNLFSLYEAGIQGQAGYEVSKYGVMAGEAISGQFDCGIPFGQQNLLNDDIDAEGATVFTYYCFEQIKSHTEAVLSRIHSWKPGRVIHIEPVRELYGKALRDRASRLYIDIRDYQNRLLTTLQQMERQGQVTILHAERLGYAANILHEGSCIVWKPRA